MNQDSDQRKIPLRRVAPERLVIVDDNRPLCRICSEMPVTDTLRGVCTRCARALDDERDRDW